MLEFVPFIIALVGSSIAAAWDLKTTEIPDEISYIMMAIALAIYGTQSFLAWDYWPILYSCIVGLSFLGFGFAMYYLGQWGGGDAKLLSAIGFLLPAAPSFLNFQFFFPFPVSYMINVFLVGAAYMLLYAVVLAFMNRKILKEFKRDVKASVNFLLIAIAILFATFVAIGFYLAKALYLNVSIDVIIENTAVPLLLTVSLLMIWKFVRAVENVGFKRRINVRELKVGDVMMENKLWEGITEKELRTIRRKKRYVWIKEGVRFAPAFPFALLMTLWIGDALFLFIKYFV